MIMDTISKMTLWLCTACIICSVLNVIAPIKQYDRILKPIFGIFVVLCFSVIVAQTVNSFSFTVPQYTENVTENNEDEINDFISETMRKYVSKSIENVLMSKYIEHYDMDITTDISEDGSISISRVKIILDNYAGDKETLKEEIYSKAGVIPTISDGGR